jgi:hypothetical protein
MATGDSARPDRDAAEEPVTVEALTDGDTGCWQVTTEASIYLIDLGQRLLTRVPGAGPHAEGHAFTISTMSIDHHPVPLARLVVCQLGYGLYALTDPDSRSTVHVSISTPIVEIRRLDPATTDPGSPRADHDPDVPRVSDAEDVKDDGDT